MRLPRKIGLSQAAAVTAIESGADEFYVGSSGQPVTVVALTQGGQKYLPTEREKIHPDELLRLPSAR